MFAYNAGLRIDTIMGATWSLVDRDMPGWICPAGDRHVRELVKEFRGLTSVPALSSRAAGWL